MRPGHRIYVEVRVLVRHRIIERSGDCWEQCKPLVRFPLIGGVMWPLWAWVRSGTRPRRKA